MTVSQPSSENRFWPRYFLCRNCSNCSASISFCNSSFFVSTASGCVSTNCSRTCRADPFLLLVALDVAILDADLSAICPAKDLEDPPQSGSLFAVQAAGDKFAVEVPDRQAKILEVELGRVMRSHVQRIDICEHVAADTIGVYQLQNVGLFLDLLAERSPPNSDGLWSSAQRSGGVVDLEIIKNIVVKLVLPDEELVISLPGTGRSRHPGSRGDHRYLSA